MNKVKVIIIILIAVTIIFAILGTFNLYAFKEGMDDVPKCENSLDDEDDKRDIAVLRCDANEAGSFDGEAEEALGATGEEEDDDKL